MSAHDHAAEVYSNIFERRFHEFWDVFWNFGHTASEISWDIITASVAYLVGRYVLRRHDRIHHHHDHKDTP